jgi:hypothetical protein
MVSRGPGAAFHETSAGGVGWEKRENLSEQRKIRRMNRAGSMVRTTHRSQGVNETLVKYSER